MDKRFLFLSVYKGRIRNLDIIGMLMDHRLRMWMRMYFKHNSMIGVNYVRFRRQKQHLQSQFVFLLMCNAQMWSNS